MSFIFSSYKWYIKIFTSELFKLINLKFIYFTLVMLTNFIKPFKFG